MNTKPYLIEIVGLDNKQSDNYLLHIVEISTLPELSSHDKQNFIYLSDVKIYQKDLAYAALSSRSFDDMRHRLQENLGTSSLEPLIAKSDGVFRASTFESLLILSSYYHFEEYSKLCTQTGFITGRA